MDAKRQTDGDVRGEDLFRHWETCAPGLVLDPFAMRAPGLLKASLRATPLLDREKAMRSQAAGVSGVVAALYKISCSGVQLPICLVQLMPDKVVQGGVGAGVFPSFFKAGSIGCGPTDP